MDRRDYLKAIGALSGVSLAGCTTSCHHEPPPQSETDGFLYDEHDFRGGVFEVEDKNSDTWLILISDGVRQPLGGALDVVTPDMFDMEAGVEWDREVVAWREDETVASGSVSF